MSQYSAERVEAHFDDYAKALDKLDTLDKQLLFVETEYEGDDQLELRAQVHGEIVKLEQELALMDEPKSLTRLARENEEMTIDMIMLMVNDLKSFFIVDRVISSDGIKALAPLIVTTFGELTLEEVAVCFNMAKTGVYGEIYARLDGQVIMGWLRKYVQDKRERKHMKAVNYHLQNKVVGDADRGGDDNQAKLKMAIHAVKVEKELREKKK